ncbi:unnamed protein product [Vitrella brassicaformis CCMP3155]|uniref:Uncharacterized protein n=1 Tax=Vitrella brassicaformis (strain CCMP3155) TaxID=1169540 RepID=A0A0G4EKG5_VITBC|nr:unnamed protein product [Vitrella brassicaformis CCMP3155]|eukprot:CEL97050.1 unnamed protein product [Vitrella brassicaformis CCMP3155]
MSTSRTAPSPMSTTNLSDPFSRSTKSTVPSPRQRRLLPHQEHVEKRYIDVLQELPSVEKSTLSKHRIKLGVRDEFGGIWRPIEAARLPGVGEYSLVTDPRLRWKGSPGLTLPGFGMERRMLETLPPPHPTKVINERLRPEFYETQLEKVRDVAVRLRYPTTVGPKFGTAPTNSSRKVDIDELYRRYDVKERDGLAAAKSDEPTQAPANAEEPTVSIEAPTKQKEETLTQSGPGEREVATAAGSERPASSLVDSPPPPAAPDSHRDETTAATKGSDDQAHPARAEKQMASASGAQGAGGEGEKCEGGRDVGRADSAK